MIHGIGEHFSSGLDLSELTEQDATEGLRHSQMWHRVFNCIQYGRVPVIAALKGAVIGGGLELAVRRISASPSHPPTSRCRKASAASSSAAAARCGCRA